MNRLVGTALAAVICMGALAQMASHMAPGTPSAAVPATGPEPRARAFEEHQADETTVIPRDASGQFHLTGRINGSESRFLVDTGADVVALTIETAEQAGIAVDTSRFEPILQTASGPGYGAHYRANELEIAGHPFRDVDVVVVNGLGANLLGQSLLRQIGKVELKGDSLVIGGD